MLQKHGSDRDRLQLSINEWHDRSTFSTVRHFLFTVKVVNDAAEKGRKLNADYATVLTDHEQRGSRIIQAVKQHGQEYPVSKNVCWH